MPSRTRVRGSASAPLNLGSGVVQPRFRFAAVGRHRIAAVDPVLADVLDSALLAHIAPTTRATYTSACKQYLGFCDTRHLSPFPVDAVWLAAYCVFACMFISVNSLKVYLSSIRSAHIDTGFDWEMSGNQTVARAIRFVKRKYGMADKALKVPVSLATLHRMCRCLKGWPNMRKMLFDDVVFVTASIIAIVCFLRGGEFLYSGPGSRPLLRHCDVVLSPNEDGKASVSVRVAQPKARWWLQSVSVPCFDLGPGCPLNPSAWLSHYRVRARSLLTENGPAFVRICGAPLDKSWMLSRTSMLLSRAGIHIIDAQGCKVAVKASSWRAGGVQSAKEAGLSDPIIKALGRWTSVAWFHYLFASHADLRKAVGSMWQAAAASPSSLMVGSFAPSGLFEDKP
jgi:hypothetical protein